MPIITIHDCLNCNTDHEWLFEGPTLRELRMIKKLTGMNQKQFGEAGDDGDPDALAALIAILHQRDKIKIPFDDVDLDFAKFEMKPTEQELKEMAEADAAAENEVPKSENGPTRKVASKHKS